MKKRLQAYCASVLALVLAFSLLPATLSSADAAPVNAQNTVQGLAASTAIAAAAASDAASDAALIPNALRTLAIPAVEPSQNKDQKKFEDNQLVVAFEQDAPLDQQIAELSNQLEKLHPEALRNSSDVVEEVQIIGEDAGGSTQALFVLAEDVALSDALTLAQQDDDVAAVQPNYIYSLQDMGVSDPYSKNSSATDDVNQWYLYKPEFRRAWTALMGNSTVRVAVIDSGIRINHDDLVNVIDKEHAWDVVQGTALTTDLSGHGTHVAGIIGAETNNRTGISGVSFNRAKIVPINVFQRDPKHPTAPTATSSSILKAFNYLFSLNLPDLKVINMSLGSYGSKDPAFEAAINEATQRGIMVVAAAGNATSSDPVYPSDYANVVSVTATDANDKIATFSDHNNSKDIAAPGVRLLSTWATSDYAYAYSSGTSMASPVVAGIAAMLFSLDPTLTVADAKDILYATAKDLGAQGKDEYFGYGRVDAGAAVGLLRSRFGGVAIEPQVIAGGSRQDTAAQLAVEAYPEGAEGVIIANGEGQGKTGKFPDALASSSLAGLLGYPILLTAPNSLSSYTINALQTLKPKQIVILGDKNSITESVKNQLTRYAPVQRIAGTNRLETAVQIYRFGAANGTWNKTAIFADAGNFPDALAIAPFAGHSNFPIFLVQGDKLSASVASILKADGFTDAIVVGSNKSVSDKIATQIKSIIGKDVTRLQGANRYATGQKIAQYSLDHGMSLEGAGIATAENFPDALAGGPLLAKNNAVILLASDNDTSALDLLKDQTGISKIRILGGDGAVSQKVRFTATSNLS